MTPAKLFVVDDDADANFALKSILEHSGFTVREFFDGESALNKLKEEKPDMVLMDVMMPGISGYDVCEKIKNDPETSHIPVIMITAKDMGEDVEIAIQKKADWFVTKPYDFKYLVAKINQILSKDAKLL